MFWEPNLKTSLPVQRWASVSQPPIPTAGRSCSPTCCPGLVTLSCWTRGSCHLPQAPAHQRRRPGVKDRAYPPVWKATGGVPCRRRHWCSTTSCSWRRRYNRLFEIMFSHSCGWHLMCKWYFFNLSFLVWRRGSRPGDWKRLERFGVQREVGQQPANHPAVPDQPVWSQQWHHTVALCKCHLHSGNMWNYILWYFY